MFGWYKYCFSHYFTLSGRASRAQFWSFFFVNGFIFILLALGGAIIGLALSTPSSEAEEAANAAPSLSVFVLFLAAAIIYYCVSILPSIAVTVRRMHDRDLSGWWVGVTLLLFIIGGGLSIRDLTLFMLTGGLFGGFSSIIAVITFLLSFFILICMCLSSLPAPNKYGLRAPSSPTDIVPSMYTMPAAQWAAPYDVQNAAGGVGQILPNTPQPQQNPNQNPPQQANANSSPVPQAQPAPNNQGAESGTKSLLEEMRGEPINSGNSSTSASASASSTHRPTTPQESSLVSSLRNKSQNVNKS